MLGRICYSSILDIPSVRENKTLDYHRTDSGSPPFKTPPCKESGNYCMRATTLLYNNENDLLATIHGYDTTPDIVDRVETACDRELKLINNGYCSNSKLYFLRNVKDCNGRINIIKEE